MFRFGPGSGCILEIILEFGVGAGSGAFGAVNGNLTKFDFSRAGNSGLIAILRRF